ncbi:MAG: hypothetical protein WC865_00040 [Bacteroidales bacterium]
MNFICEELSIADDPNFGFTIQFSDTKDPGYIENQSINEMIKSKEKYFLLQRSYPEELDENDFYYIETSESDEELGNLDKVIIQLSKDKIKIQWSGDKVEIGLRLDERELLRLRKLLKTRFQEKVIMIEN